MAQARKIARGAMSRDPKRETDVKGGEGGDAAKAAGRLARRTPTERLSPGVYRSASGDLVTQSGKPIRRQPQAPMAQQIAGMQQGMAGGMPQGMAQQIGAGTQGAGGTPGAALTAATGGADMGGMVNYPAQMPGNAKWPQVGQQVAYPGQPWGEVSDAMYRIPGMPQMPQASANMGGQYRLSPGVYGTREQAMQQYNQQMQQYNPAMMAQAGQAAMQGMQGDGNGGAGSFPMQQRERELGYAENRFNAAKDNNLFRGNPVRRFRF